MSENTKDLITNLLKDQIRKSGETTLTEGLLDIFTEAVTPDEWVAAQLLREQLEKMQDRPSKLVKGLSFRAPKLSGEAINAFRKYSQKFIKELKAIESSYFAQRRR